MRDIEYLNLERRVHEIEAKLRRVREALESLYSPLYHGQDTTVDMVVSSICDALEDVSPG